MYTLGQILGFLTVLFVVLAMHRMIIRLSSPHTNKWFEKYPKFLAIKKSMAKFMVQNHQLFAILAVVFAFIHAGYNFVQTGQPSFTGAAIVMVLLLQMVVGKLIQSNRRYVWVHRVLPFLGLAALVAHIFQK